MKKTVLIALCLSLVSFEASAISRHNAASMSCNEARAVIRSEGAVILRWRSVSGAQRFGRYVRNDAFCPSSEIAKLSNITTADRRSCSVWECQQYSPEDDDFWFLRRGW